LLGQINVPTLLLVGAEDSLSPPDEMRTLQEAIPNSVLVEVPAAGHIANMENPAVFTAALEQFLSRL
jgi:pimeloyl-ACP methyl ester carboxylesterase